MLKLQDKNLTGVYKGDNCVEYIIQDGKIVYEKLFTRKLKPGVIILYDMLKEKLKGCKPNKLEKIDLVRFVPVGLVCNDNLMFSLPIMVCNDPENGSIDKNSSLSNRVDMGWGPALSVSGIPNRSKEEDARQDFDGENNSKRILNARGDKDYAGGWKPNDLTTSASYPAVSCCDIFKTLGTEQTSWWLPSIGELSYMENNYDLLNDILNKMIELGVRCCNLEGDSYWSSTDGGTIYAWRLKIQTSMISRELKATDTYKVRAFHRIDKDMLDETQDLKVYEPDNGNGNEE